MPLPTLTNSLRVVGQLGRWQAAGLCDAPALPASPPPHHISVGKPSDPFDSLSFTSACWLLPPRTAWSPVSPERRPTDRPTDHLATGTTSLGRHRVPSPSHASIGSTIGSVVSLNNQPFGHRRRSSRVYYVNVGGR